MGFKDYWRYRMKVLAFAASTHSNSINRAVVGDAAIRPVETHAEVDIKGKYGVGGLGEA